MTTLLTFASLRYNDITLQISSRLFLNFGCDDRENECEKRYIEMKLLSIDSDITDGIDGHVLENAKYFLY